jgi:hypothetical protein
MPTEIEIKGHGGRIGIVVLGYAETDSANLADANWLACAVHIELGPFRGEVNAAFTTRDFEAFSQELRDLLGGERSSALFETYEEVLQLRIEGRPTGATPITGTIQYSDGPIVRLSFTLQSDQSYLVSVVRALDAVAHQFPVRR